MKVMTSLLFAALIFSQINFAQKVGNNNNNNASEYDSSFAKRLGADEYGMKQYVIAFLKSGLVKIADSTKRAELQKKHLKNIIRLAKEGKLIVAGPFLDNGEIRGIFIFNVETVEEAKDLADTDPKVKAGTLILELHPWYGSAAIAAIPEIEKKIQKNKIIN